MGTVYNLPVIQGLVAGDSNGINSSSEYWTPYNSVLTSGLYVCYCRSQGHTLRFYTAANSPNVKVAFYLESDHLGSARKSNTGIIYGNCVNLVDVTWHSYHFYQASTELSYYVHSDLVVLETNLDFFDSREDALAALDIGTKYPITYRFTNCTASSAPDEAAIGDTITVPFVFPDGYGIVNPSSDVYVTNNGVVIPSQYSNGTLTFTMPDPS